MEWGSMNMFANIQWRKAPDVDQTFAQWILLFYTCYDIFSPTSSLSLSMLPLLSYTTHYSAAYGVWWYTKQKKKETNAHIKVASSETNTVSPAANYPNCPVCSINKVHALTKLSIVIDANEIKFGTSSQTSAAVVPHNSRANEIKQKQKCIWLVD